MSEVKPMAPESMDKKKLPANAPASVVLCDGPEDDTGLSGSSYETPGAHPVDDASFAAAGAKAIADEAGTDPGASSADAGSDTGGKRPLAFSSIPDDLSSLATPTSGPMLQDDFWPDEVTVHPESAPVAKQNQTVSEEKKLPETKLAPEEDGQDASVAPVSEPSADVDAEAVKSVAAEKQQRAAEIHAAAAAVSSAGMPPSDYWPSENNAVPAPAAPVSAAASAAVPAKAEAEKKEQPLDDDDPENSSMKLTDHLRDLRRCLVRSILGALVCALGCFAGVEYIFDAVTFPLLTLLPEGSKAIYTSLPEAFFIRVLISMVGGIFIASPYIFYEIWKFISPALYKNEKHFILPVAIVSAISFIGGGAFCYCIVFKYAFAFFLSFSTDQIVSMPRIADYVEFVIKLILAFGLVFEMPIFTFFLSRMGLVTAAGMRSVWRFAVLIIFIAAAILTPPDVISQLLMAGPMLLLYEVSILVAYIFGKKKKVEKTSEENDESDDTPPDDSGAGVSAAPQAATVAPAQDASTSFEQQYSAKEQQNAANGYVWEPSPFSGPADPGVETPEEAAARAAARTPDAPAASAEQGKQGESVSSKQGTEKK